MNGCILLCHISLKLQEFWVGKCEVMHVFWLNLRCNPLKKKFRDVIGAFYVDYLWILSYYVHPHVVPLCICIMHELRLDPLTLSNRRRVRVAFLNAYVGRHATRTLYLRRGQFPGLPYS